MLELEEGLVQPRNERKRTSWRALWSLACLPDSFAFKEQPPTTYGRAITWFLIPLLLGMFLGLQITLNSIDSHFATSLTTQTECQDVLFTCSALGGCVVAIVPTGKLGWSPESVQHLTRLRNSKLFGTSWNRTVASGDTVPLTLCPGVFEFLDIARNDIAISTFAPFRQVQASTVVCLGCSAAWRAITLPTATVSDSLALGSGSGPLSFVRWLDQGGFDLVTMMQLSTYNVTKSTLATTKTLIVQATITPSPGIGLSALNTGVDLGGKSLAPLLASGVIANTIGIAGTLSTERVGAGALLTVFGVSSSNDAVVFCAASTAGGVGSCKPVDIPGIARSGDHSAASPAAANSGRVFLTFPTKSGAEVVLVQLSPAGGLTVLHSAALAFNYPGATMVSLCYDTETGAVVHGVTYVDASVAVHCITGLNETLSRQWSSCYPANQTGAHLIGSLVCASGEAYWWSGYVLHRIQSASGLHHSWSTPLPITVTEVDEMEAFWAALLPRRSSHSSTIVTAFRPTGASILTGLIGQEVGSSGSLLVALDPSDDRVARSPGFVKLGKSKIDIAAPGTVMSSSLTVQVASNSSVTYLTEASPEAATFLTIPCTPATTLNKPCVRINLSKTSQKTVSVSLFTPLQVVSNLGTALSFSHLVLGAICVRGLCGRRRVETA